MKTKFKMKNVMLLLVVTLLSVTACQNEDTVATTDDVAIDDALAQRSAEIDLISDDIGIIVEEAYQEDESYVSFLPECVTITTEISTGFIERTLDFGDGCELPNGNIVAGIIVTSHAVDSNPARRDISVTFDNFTRNDVLIEGTRSIERVLANDAGNPQSTAQVAMQVTWQDGTTATREGIRIREWIEGFGSGVWSDNVFSITGSVTTTGILGNTYAAIITTPLRREMVCAFIVSGTIELSRNDNTGTLSYGEGSCDNEAVWTNPNGNTTTIYLD
ncbi:hypothetical protein U8527_05650 [Kordia algicida OT-1]|uniref:Lipoprotein n=1 Tax=Kordia algicida OT-1 TaxID=391587 RepID=A9DMX6_9FLAO|nr:hypothetical protein [Kordia algicida]EDP97810.1 hypothetical protein KAOT1_21647 [Kordia algicida OT-1]